MGPRVWLAGEGDVESVSALLAEFRDHMGRDTPTDAEIRATVDVLSADPHTEFLLAAPDAEEAAAGVCQLRYRLTVWTGADDCCLEDLFVARAARHAGLGRALVSAALERAEARGCRRIDLDVSEENGNALALYREMGFNTGSKPLGRNLYAMRRL
ncbi:MAG: hypothetical protein QOD71_276 [Thermoleophilaceae bacterium]|jgi:ribosomal protein S18 acetylase RimI-like enzyme|nr:hypothetical protein [Thermoleophilaceae bacterium]